MPKQTKKKDSTTAITAGKEDNHKRRNRVPISCTICRRRKVKCTKERPVCKGCEKTGVGHLCHYIEPAWAQPVESSPNAGDLSISSADLNNISTNGTPEEQNSLISKLKDRIKALETELYGSASSAGSSPAPNQSLLPLSTCSSHNTTSSNDYEVLNLGKKFDMLHIKSTTTVHLGPTSWLAIMKGDPYLRVLWAHIFKMRKQVEDFKFMVRQRQLAAQGINIKCPVSFQQSGTPDPITSSMCPVQQMRKPTPRPRQATAITNQSQCASDKEEMCPMSDRSEAYGMKCPVVHSHTQTNITGKGGKLQTPPNSSSATPKNNKGDDSSLAKGCPLMIDGSTFLGPSSVSISREQQVKKHQLEGEVKFLQKAQPRTSTSDSPKRTKHQQTTSPSNGGVEEVIASGKKVDELFRDDKAKTLELLLPTKEVLWLLIDRFFEVLYIYMPYIDEESFRQEIKFIFGEFDPKNTEAEHNKIKLNIRIPVDFALIGTVCILLRLSWLTLPKNSSNAHLGKNTTTKTYADDMTKIRTLELTENEISIELINCVKQYINNNNDNDQLIKKSNLKVLQFAVFLKFYTQYSPEEKDSADGSDSQVFLGMIVHMAIRIGLHRDPSNFENFNNERQRHLWRKLWFCLVSMDVEQSVNLGCPRALETYLEFSDTKFPNESQFTSDLRELTVIKLMKTQYQVDLLLARSMRVLLNVKKPARKYQIDHLIEELTRHLNCFSNDGNSPGPSSTSPNSGDSLPQLGTILINRTKNEPLYSSATRAYQFKLISQANMFLYLLNYILFVHFEPLGTKDISLYKMAKDHAQKALDAALEGYRNCTLFFDCNLDYFGPGADLIISPLLLLIGHRSIQFMVSLILRSRCGPYMRPAVSHGSQNGSFCTSATQDPVLKEENSDGEAIKSGLNPVNNRNYDLQEVEIKDESSEHSTNFYNTDVDSGETLAKILLKHMENFHKLTDKLGEKYPYSWRMSKAVGFFVTLLRKPVNIVKAIVKTDNVKLVENNTGFASNVLNSVPLVLNEDEVGIVLNPKNNGNDEEEQFEDAEDPEVQNGLKRTATNDSVSSVKSVGKCPVSHSSSGKCPVAHSGNSKLESIDLSKSSSVTSTSTTTTNTNATSIPLSTQPSSATTILQYQANDLFKGIPDFIVPNSQMLFDFNEINLDQSINEIFNNNNVLSGDNPMNFNFAFANSNNITSDQNPPLPSNNNIAQQAALQGDGNGELDNDLFGNLMMAPSFSGDSLDTVMNLNMNNSGFDFNIDTYANNNNSNMMQNRQNNNNAYLNMNGNASTGIYNVDSSSGFGTFSGLFS